VWKTYKEVYDIVIKLGNSLRSCGIKEVQIHIYYIFFICPQIMVLVFLKFVSYALICGNVGRKMWYIWYKLLWVDH